MLIRYQAEVRINDITGGLGAHAVIVAVGASKAYQMAMKLLRPLGTLICVGLPGVGLHIPVSVVDCVNRGKGKPVPMI